MYGTYAKGMNLSISQYSEQAFKAILGGCRIIVQYLGTLINQVSDDHGKGRKAVKPKPRHAELAVNVAGAMAAFLVETWQEQRE
ncbi:abortive infection family protein [Tunicatimonas pelagia]|uniref:abortive infection family protein n=1 Tax=Tunicatimonas pelagia TaxID=931531 RepID=UPI00345C83AE